MFGRPSNSNSHSSSSHATKSRGGVADRSNSASAGANTRVKVSLNPQGSGGGPATTASYAYNGGAGASNAPSGALSKRVSSSSLLAATGSTVAFSGEPADNAGNSNSRFRGSEQQDKRATNQLQQQPLPSSASAASSPPPAMSALARWGYGDLVASEAAAHDEKQHERQHVAVDGGSSGVNRPNRGDDDYSSHHHHRHNDPLADSAPPPPWAMYYPAGTQPPTPSEIRRRHDAPPVVYTTLHNVQPTTMAENAASAFQTSATMASSSSSSSLHHTHHYHHRQSSSNSTAVGVGGGGGGYTPARTTMNMDFGSSPAGTVHHDHQQQQQPFLHYHSAMNASGGAAGGAYFSPFHQQHQNHHHAKHKGGYGGDGVGDGGGVPNISGSANGLLEIVSRTIRSSPAEVGLSVGGGDSTAPTIDISRQFSNMFAAKNNNQKHDQHNQQGVNPLGGGGALAGGGGGESTSIASVSASTFARTDRSQLPGAALSSVSNSNNNTFGSFLGSSQIQQQQQHLQNNNSIGSSWPPAGVGSGGGNNNNNNSFEGTNVLALVEGNNRSAQRRGSSPHGYSQQQQQQQCSSLSSSPQASVELPLDQLRNANNNGGGYPRYHHERNFSGVSALSHASHTPSQSLSNLVGGSGGSGHHHHNHNQQHPVFGTTPTAAGAMVPLGLLGSSSHHNTSVSVSPASVSPASSPRRRRGASHSPSMGGVVSAAAAGPNFGNGSFFHHASIMGGGFGGSSPQRQLPFDVSVSSMASEDFLAMDGDLSHSPSLRNLRLAAANQQLHLQQQQLQLQQQLQAVAMQQEALQQQQQQQQQMAMAAGGGIPAAANTAPQTRERRNSKQPTAAGGVDLRAQHAAAIKQRKNAAKQQQQQQQSVSTTPSASQEATPSVGTAGAVGSVLAAGGGGGSARETSPQELGSTSPQVSSMNVSSYQLRGGSGGGGGGTERSSSVPFSSAPPSPSQQYLLDPSSLSQQQSQEGSGGGGGSLESLLHRSNAVHSILDRALESDLASVFRGAIIPPPAQHPPQQQQQAGLGGGGGEKGLHRHPLHGGKYPSKLSDMAAVPTATGGGHSSLLHPHGHHSAHHQQGGGGAGDHQPQQQQAGEHPRFPVNIASTMGDDGGPTPAEGRGKPYPSIAATAVSYVLHSGDLNPTATAAAAEAAAKRSRRAARRNRRYGYGGGGGRDDDDGSRSLSSSENNSSSSGSNSDRSVFEDSASEREGDTTAREQQQAAMNTPHRRGVAYKGGESGGAAFEMFFGDSPAAGSPAVGGHRSRVKPDASVSAERKMRHSSHTPHQQHPHHSIGNSNNATVGGSHQHPTTSFNPLYASASAHASSVGVRKKSSVLAQQQQRLQAAAAASSSLVAAATTTHPPPIQQPADKASSSGPSPSLLEKKRRSASGGGGGGATNKLRSSSSTSNNMNVPPRMASASANAANSRSGSAANRSHSARSVVSAASTTATAASRLSTPCDLKNREKSLPTASIDLGGGRMAPIAVAGGAHAPLIADAFIADHGLDPLALRVALIEFLNYTSASMEAEQKLRSSMATTGGGVGGGGGRSELQLSRGPSILGQQRRSLSRGGRGGGGRDRSPSAGVGNVPRVATLEAPRVRRERERDASQRDGGGDDSRSHYGHGSKKKGNSNSSANEGQQPRRSSFGDRYSSEEESDDEGGEKKTHQTKQQRSSSSRHKPNINERSRRIVEQMRRRSLNQHEEDLLLMARRGVDAASDGIDGRSGAPLHQTQYGGTGRSIFDERTTRHDAAPTHLHRGIGNTATNSAVPSYMASTSRTAATIAANAAYGTNNRHKPSATTRTTAVASPSPRRHGRSVSRGRATHANTNVSARVATAPMADTTVMMSPSPQRGGTRGGKGAAAADEGYQQPFHPDLDLASPRGILRGEGVENDACSIRLNNITLEVDGDTRPATRRSSTTMIAATESEREGGTASLAPTSLCDGERSPGDGSITPTVATAPSSSTFVGTVPSVLLATAYDSGAPAHVAKAALPVHLRLHPTAHHPLSSTGRREGGALKGSGAAARAASSTARGPTAPTPATRSRSGDGVRGGGGDLMSPGRRMHQDAMVARQKRDDAHQQRLATLAAAEAATFVGRPTITRAGQRANSRVTQRGPSNGRGSSLASSAGRSPSQPQQHEALRNGPTGALGMGLSSGDHTPVRMRQRASSSGSRTATPVGSAPRSRANSLSGGSQTPDGCNGGSTPTAPHSPSRQKQRHAAVGAVPDVQKMGRSAGGGSKNSPIGGESGGSHSGGITPLGRSSVNSTPRPHRDGLGPAAASPSPISRAGRSTNQPASSSTVAPADGDPSQQHNRSTHVDPSAVSLSARLQRSRDQTQARLDQLRSYRDRVDPATGQRFFEPRTNRDRRTVAPH